MSKPIKRAEIVQDLDLLTMLVRQASVEWIVIHTNPKCEIRAFEGLIAKDVMAYLPIEKCERVEKRRGRKYTVKRPLFCRYVFAGIDRAKGQTIDDVRACDGVEGILSIEENGAPVRVNPKDLVKVIAVAHGTFEGDALPDDYMAKIADLPSGAVLHLVKGHLSGLDFTLSAYDRAKGALRGEVKGLRVSVPVDAVEI